MKQITNQFEHGRRGLIFFLIPLYLFIFHSSSYADHICGMDLTYECAGQDTAGNDRYVVKLVLYYDCTGSGGSLFQNLCYKSVSCGYSKTITISKEPSNEPIISKVCPAINTRCDGGPFRGIRRYTYIDTVTLPFKCDDWVFLKPLCCRPLANNTIVKANVVGSVIQAELDNLNFSCNNSPTFSTYGALYFCENEKAVLKQGVSEQDGDSLVFKLTTPRIGPGGCIIGGGVPYKVGYSYTQPLTSVPPVTFDSFTGDLTFTPTVAGEITSTGFTIEEYRNGIKVGSVMRDIEITVLNCTNVTKPTLAGIDSNFSFTDSVCANDSVYFDVIGIEPDSGQSYTLTWDSGIAGASFIVSGNPPKGRFSWLTSDGDTIANPYTFNVTITDSGCMQKSFDTTYTIYVLPRPTPNSILGKDTVCPMELGVSYSVNGISGSTFNWIIENGMQVSGGNSAMISVNWFDTTFGGLNVIETSQYGCVGDTVFKGIIFKPQVITSVIDGSPFVCPSDDSIDYWLNKIPGSSYNWIITRGTLINGQSTDSIQVNWDSTGSAIVAVIETNSNGCISDTATFPVNINVVWTPIAPIGPDTLCALQGDSVAYIAAYTNGATYYWYIQGGKILNGDSTFSVYVKWDTIGQGFIWYEEENITIDTVCFNNSDTTWVIILPSPYSKSIIGDTRVCEFDSLLIYSVIDTGGGSAYLWAVPSGTIMTGQGTKSITVNWDTAGTYTIKVIETNTVGCDGDSIYVVVNVFDKPMPQGIFGETIICYPDTTNKVYSVSGFPGSTFDWNITGGNIISGNGSDSINVQWTIPGTGFLNLVEISIDTCLSDTLSMNITLDNPIINIDVVSDLENDENDIEIIWDLMNDENFRGVYYIFRKANNPDSNWLFLDSTQMLQYFDEGLTTNELSYIYHIRGINACFDTFTSLAHNSILLIGIADESSKNIHLNWSAYLNWPFGVDNYQIWRKLDGELVYSQYSSVSDIELFKYDMGSEGTKHCFRINAIEKAGNNNSWSNEICFEFTHQIKIPNAFTPNGDGVNDTWVIKSIEAYPDNELKVFNRWGNLIFESIGYLNEWGGTFKGQKVVDGTYYYVLKVNEDDGTNFMNYTGSITIMR